MRKTKPLPDKKHKCEYHKCFEEAFGDMIMDDDVNYLNRLIKDANENNVNITKFKTFDISIWIDQKEVISRLHVNDNFATAEMRIPQLSLKFIVSPVEIDSQSTYMRLEYDGIKEKIKGVQKMLKSIYSE